ncbi:hypothetical protein O181_018183 [Austropuccinia psidii MF-1]|uniref:Uncharacterized protein n=1 Tax=Austropuccinia psidii MF-1 TaxID=1389203 RepID=A0A9Q3C8K6_9BASI|nr:hypothetical protein [Austropuccinia psidii MF-1]
MPIQHSPPARQTRSQARAQVVLTPTPRAPLEGTPAVPKLRAQLDRGPTMEGEAPFRKEGRVPRRTNSLSGVVDRFPGLSRSIFKGPGEDVEESDGTEGAPAPVGVSQGTGGPTLAPFHQPLSHQSEPSLLAIMKQMNQIIANLQATSSSESSRPPAFKTPSMKAQNALMGLSPSELEALFSLVNQLFIMLWQTSLKTERSILIDSDATNSFIAKQFVQKFSLTTSELPEKIPFIILDSWLITFHADHKDHYYPSKSFSNDFSSAKSRESLVGDSRTSSLLSSFHIPSLNSHKLLISSRDEVFKQIKDVGEDNSVSSLHLFFGNMDLPPSSYHDLLEKLWNEEEEPEEIETVMEVVPSVYHQYLDLFSKVKAKKLAPHHACDHHIELEGYLPPVGVIYSLSKQDSDTLRAYISEILEKVFIWSRSSSSGAPVPFVKKKDGGLCLCVDYCKLNAVTRKNNYTVPPINQLLTVFNGSSIFS